MKDKEKKEHVLLYKTIYSIMIILIYVAGINIPLYKVSTEEYHEEQIDAQQVLSQLVNGDIKNASVFSLGLWSYMLASMVAMLIVAILSADKTRKIFPGKVNRLTLVLTIAIALLQGISNIQTFSYVDNEYILLTKVIVILEMITGMFLVIYLCDRLSKYGVGGRTCIFTVNIFNGFISMIKGQSFESLILPLTLGIVEMGIMFFMELKEKRIPVQRVSIHNIYADKDYIAYKFNPVGVMPLMFTSVVFLLPQFVLTLLAGIFPGNKNILWIATNMTLDKPLGIVVYLLIIGILNVTFSFLMLSPGSTAEGLLKAGDSILDVYAGRQTKRYLRRAIFGLSVFSSLVLMICQGIPLFLTCFGYIDSKLAMFPYSVMMLTGLFISLYREVKVYSHIDHYKLLV